MSIIRRSLDQVLSESSKAVRILSGQQSLVHSKQPLSLINFAQPQSLQNTVLGCDSDIGGLSKVSLDHDPSTSSAILQGNFSTRIPSDSKLERSGYAAFRTRPPGRTFFGQSYINVDLYDCMALRVKSDRRRYFVNIQAADVNVRNLWQHRLLVQKPGEWEDIYIPFDDFTLTNSGTVLGGQSDGYALDKMRVRTVGLSLLDRTDGPFKLSIQAIDAINMSKDDLARHRTSLKERMDLDDYALATEEDEEPGYEVDPTDKAWEERLVQRRAEQAERERMSKL